MGPISQFTSLSLVDPTLTHRPPISQSKTEISDDEVRDMHQPTSLWLWLDLHEQYTDAELYDDLPRNVRPVGLPAQRRTGEVLERRRAENIRSITCNLCHRRYPDEVFNEEGEAKRLHYTPPSCTIP